MTQDQAWPSSHPRSEVTLNHDYFLTLGGTLYQVFECRIGYGFALDWIIDRYQVRTDKLSGIVNDPNRAENPQYIVKLIGKIITVSLETMKIVRGLPAL